ncbi:MAG: hypothetical protein JW779_01790 [Candidatus Thorarchaeota archaeon]|nr:hypothetical protein [Candidatus Thorarchaeota archaeon]
MQKRNPRGALEDEPYSWKKANGEVHIFWNGSCVTILRKARALKFIEQIAEVGGIEAQLIMAKTTGNFKRGNERSRK